MGVQAFLQQPIHPMVQEMGLASWSHYPASRDAIFRPVQQCNLRRVAFLVLATEHSRQRINPAGVPS